MSLQSFAKSASHRVLYFSIVDAPLQFPQLLRVVIGRVLLQNPPIIRSLGPRKIRPVHRIIDRVTHPVTILADEREA